MGNFNRDSRGRGRSFGRRDFGSRDFNRGRGRGGDSRMFKAICSECGKECEVPFRPVNVLRKKVEEDRIHQDHKGQILEDQVQTRMNLSFML